MTNAVAMFPGQGSQYVGMARSLLDNWATSHQTFEEAEDAIGISLRKLCNEGPEDALKLTINTQPCLLTCSVAAWRIIKEESGFEPIGFCGHSLGEYSALVASGRMSFPKAVSLVRHRGEAMQTAVPEGEGAMAAILNMDAEELETLCKEMSDSSESVEPANYNSPGQIVVAGHTRPVMAFCEEAKNRGKRAVLLPVSAPFHSSLMQPAKDAMEPRLRATEMIENGTKFAANLKGKVEDSYDVQSLIDQIDSPVLWTQSLESFRDAGATTFVEVGPGKVLTGLIRRSLGKEFQAIQTDSLAEALPKL